ncbi:MAG: secondary thiamine-phosphate synthase enzyme YjbQ [Candidatus Eisenbacteria sp.]|nr:secondary thiamine-phosphate synthase enzyme YjbQ [Candidatus Eisenbacteria bacterium]
MTVITRRLTRKTRGHSQMLDITTDVAGIVELSGMDAGMVTVFIPGATGGVTTIEYESGLVSDMERAFETLAPENIPYAHNERWGDGNGHSHVRAAMLGPSLSVPFSGGQMILGTWQQIVVVDFDNRPRRREIVVQLMGE